MKLAVFICFLCFISIQSYAQNATAMLTITLSDVQSVKIKSPQPVAAHQVKSDTVQPEISLLNASTSSVRSFTAKQEALMSYAQNIRSNKDVTHRIKDGLEQYTARNSSSPNLLVYEINPR